MRYVILSIILIGCGHYDGAVYNNAYPTTVVNNGPSIVQLCPGVTTYGSKYVELGFCISNKLYAVYSANDGFLTEIVPGRYSSNAINSVCNFTVKDNCEVVP